jgi:hypothetical protein
MLWLDIALGAFILAILFAVVTVIASHWRSE